MKTKGVFFDLGGTLLIMRRDRIFQKVLSEQGIEVDLQSVHAAYMKVEQWWLSAYGNKSLTEEETDEAYRDLDARVFLAIFKEETNAEAERVSRIVRRRWSLLENEIPPTLYPDAEPLLHRLKGDGFILALVSNAPAETANVVDDVGLGKYLEPVVISGIVGYSKPHPEIFRITLRRAGLLPDEVIHVGDLYESDIVGARNAGIRGILIDREGIGEKYDCPRITSLGDLYPFIE